MPGAKFVLELVDKVKGPAKSAASALGGLDSKLASITKSKAFGKLDGLGNSMAKVSKGIAVGVGAAGAAIGALVAGVSAITAEVDELGKRAAKLGFPIQEFQQWEFIASQSGVSTDKFNKGMETFSKNVGAAKTGMGPLNAALKKTNPALLDQLTNAKDSGAAFDLMVASLRDIKDPMLRAKAASDAFGGAGKDMMMIAGNSADAIADLKKQAIENGLVTEDQAAAAAKYNDAMDRLERTFKAVVVNGLMPFAPAIENAAKQLQKFISENKIAEKAGKAVGDMITWVTDNMSTIKTWAKWIGYGVAAFVALTLAVKAVVAVMSFIATVGVIIGKLKAAFAIVMIGVKAFGVFAAAVGAVPILIGAALIAAVALVWYFRDEIGAFFVAVWGKVTEYSAIIWEGIKAFGQGILDALVAGFTLLTTPHRMVIDFFLGLGATVLGAIPTMMETIASFGQSILNGLISAFTLLTMPGQMVRDFLTGIGTSILGAIPGLLAGAMSIGTNIVQGIISTLSPTAIVNRVRSLGSSVLSAAKSIFGIASPSKEFAWIGEQNVAGMANAMEDKAPAAAKSMAYLGDEVLKAAAPVNDNGGGASSPLPTLASIQGSARGGGVTVNATFNFNGSGTSKEEAQEVADSMLEVITSKLELLEVAS